MYILVEVKPLYRQQDICGMRGYMCTFSDRQDLGQDNHILTYVCDPEKFSMKFGAYLFIRWGVVVQDMFSNGICEITVE